MEEEQAKLAEYKKELKSIPEKYENVLISAKQIRTYRKYQLLREVHEKNLEGLILSTKELIKLLKAMS